jgi:hypothetical protein
VPSYEPSASSLRSPWTGLSFVANQALSVEIDVDINDSRLVDHDWMKASYEWPISG